jgi:uncharacterized protein (TIGR00251 family)
VSGPLADQDDLNLTVLARRPQVWVRFAVARSSSLLMAILIRVIAWFRVSHNRWMRHGITTTGNQANPSPAPADRMIDLSPMVAGWCMDRAGVVLGLMKVPAFPITPTPTGSRLHLRVQPRASRNEVVGLHGDAIRVRLTAPPVEGAANEALVRFLAGRLDVSRGALTLVAGQAGRSKIVEVAGLTPEEAARRLAL